MKTKIGTILNEDIVQQLREQAAKQNRSMNEIIHDALTFYFRANQTHKENRHRAVERLCSRPFNLSLNEINDILEEDYFEQ